MQHRYPHRSQAFSLIELLVVMAIIVLLMQLSVTAFSGLARAANLSAGAQMLIDSFNMARQTAVTQNRNVELRMYKLPDSAGSTNRVYRAIQLFLVQPGGLEPLTRVTYLPGSVIIKDDPPTTSTVLNHTSSTLVWSLPEVGTTYDYASLRFHPSGITDIGETNNFATLVLSRDAIVANNLPANYATARIDPTSGKIKLFRP